MKSLWIIPLAILLQANGCENKQQPVSLLPQPVANTEKNKPCIDSSRIKPDAICPMNWQPVCGCDSVTYGNACAADAAGVTWYRQGECAQK